MSKIIKLSDIVPNKCYTVAGFKEESDYSDKLHKMGFVKGTVIKLAPVKTYDPMIFQIRASRIALRKKEASQILVEEIYE
ncbi:MAG: FeoA family protein [Kiritimatiellae bacterium]|jgi:ferrous iron transport protein A|nr:FeoA family protein [Kiritimatiellia bacterium]